MQPARKLAALPTVGPVTAARVTTPAAPHAASGCWDADCVKGTALCY
jgi:hypothetical protein